MKRQPKLGTVWGARARLSWLDNDADPPKWRTDREVVYAPRAIEAALADLKRANPGRSYWVRLYCAGSLIDSHPA